MNTALRACLLTLAVASILVALVAARPVATPGPWLRDFEAYWSAGVTSNANADPYERGIWNAERGVPGVDPSRDEVLPFIGPPSALPVWSLFARLPYRTAARIWWTLLAIALLALVAVVVRAGSTRPSTLSFVTAFVLAVSFGPVTSDLALGQVALLALLGACIVPTLAEASIVTAAFGSFAAFLQPNVAFGLTSQLGRNRATLAMAFGILAAYVVGAVAAGWSWPLAYARALATHGNAERWSAIQFSPASVAYGLGLAPGAATAVAVIAALAAVAAAVVVGLRVTDRFARFAAFAALAPFVAGFFHEHDLVVAYVAATWCALRTRGSTRAFALAGTLLVAIDWLGLAQRPTGIVQSALLATAALCAFVALGENVDLRLTLATSIPLAALFAGSAWLAAAHPAPVWPDSLGDFHVPAALPVATVWLDEQRAAGLLAVVPVWAFLRALSLLGCALLAYAIYRHSSCRRTASPHPD